MSFGIRFGQLVREKRAIEGLTQEALAFKAFGDEDRKTRVSELECGTVNKPHARTVDALVVALSITPEELAACRQPAPATTVDEPQPSPAATPPAPVLTAQPLFVGREDLLGRIDAACAHSEGAVIQSIQGMGGVGKTALARQAAKRFAEKGLTPDGQVFVNLRGWNSGQRMSTADALRSLCTQLDRNIDQTYSEEQLAAHWRGLTRGKRLVVILDNAADAAQVEALRPTDGITLITTRRLGLIRGIGTVDVDVMREGDAAELAQRLCPGLDEERARRLSKAVGYLPLAIEIAAGRLADGVEALEALEAKLIDSVKALDLLEELREVLSFSLAGLTDEQVARWEALSLPPGDFGEWAVQALWQTDDWANDMLALRRRHLLSPFGEGRWRLHDLLRAAAAERLTEDLEREQQLWRRLGPAAVVRLEEINKCFISGDGAMVLALATMDQELPLLRGVQSWAAGKMERDRVAAEVASRLPNYVITTLRLGRDELTWREAALCAAEHRREKAEIARAAGTLGLVYRHRGDYSRAEAMHLRSLAIAEALGDSVEQAKQRGNLGLVYDQCGRLDEAEEMLEASIAIFEELGDRAGAARNLGNLGLVYQHRGKLDQAKAMHQRSLLVAKEFGNLAEQAHDLDKLGVVYRDQGELEQAQAMHLESLAIEEKLGNQPGQVQQINNIGLVHRNRGEWSEAAAHFGRALALAEDLSMREADIIRKHLAEAEARLSEKL